MPRPKSTARPAVFTVKILPSQSKVLTAAILPLLAGIVGVVRIMPAQKTGQTAPVYVCPMHLEVRSPQPGSCKKCKMDLVRVENGKALQEYRVELTTTPSQPQQGVPIRLRFRIFDPQTGYPVENFRVVHEKVFHLFAISHDLAVFQHIHPTRQPDGSFEVETAFPHQGRYEIFSDFSPVGALRQVVRKTLTVAGAEHKAISVRARLVPELRLSKTVQGTRFDLTFDVSKAVAGTLMTLDYTLTDQSTGLPVRDLQPYLGAWGHAVVLSEDTKDFVHLHPTVAIPRPSGAIPAYGGPAVSFSTFFPRSGRYRIWSQFQRREQVLTASFDIEVLQRDPIAAWNGRSWVPFGAVPASDEIVHAIAADGKNLYAAVDQSDDFRHLTRVVKWDGKSWVELGEGFNGNVWAIAIARNKVYVGGDFTAAGITSIKGMAAWDGRAWTSLGGGIEGCKDLGCSPAVYSIAVADHGIYIGGRFSTVGGAIANGIARWNGKTWLPLGQGMRTGIYDGVVRALALHRRSVYAAGSFKTAGEKAVNHIARWDGNQWSAFGVGIGGGMERALAIGVIGGNKVLVAGDFTVAGSHTVSNAAVWDGRNWSGLEVWAGGEISSVAVTGTAVYLGGSSFTLDSGREVTGVIKWSGALSGMGLSAPRYAPVVRALAISDGRVLAAGGPFALPDPANRIPE